MGIPTHGVFAVKNKTRALVAILILVITGAMFWVAAKNNVFTSEKTIETSAAGAANKKNDLRLPKSSEEARKDTDGDGLKDWEEIIWGTNPNKADSDGDGTADGEEIGQNRDPLKKGPGDKLTQNLSNDADNNTAPDNLTYNLAKNVLESGVLNAVDQDGRVTSTDFLDKLSLPTNINPEVLLGSAVKISPKDIKLDPKNDPEAVRKYFTAVSAIYARHLPLNQQKSDLAILMAALENKDYSKLSELDPLIGAIERTISDMKALPTPSDYAATAVKELNYLSRTKKMIEIFRNTQNDPMASAIIIPERINILSDMANFHLEISRDLLAKGIISGS